LFECLPTDMRYRCSSSGRWTVACSLSLRRQQLAYPLRSLSFPLQPSLSDRCSAHHWRFSPTVRAVRDGQRCRPALVSLPAKIHSILTTRNWGNITNTITVVKSVVIITNSWVSCHDGVVTTTSSFSRGTGTRSLLGYCQFSGFRGVTHLLAHIGIASLDRPPQLTSRRLLNFQWQSP
jgi:hypothetical protein